MKKFKFRLETTLQHRETLENLREQEYQTALGHLAAIELHIKTLDETIRQAITSRPGGAPGERFDASGLYDRERYVQTLLAGLETLNQQAHAARIVVEDARQRLVAARQAREVVSHLREKDLVLHQNLQLKVEQDTMDEIATLRHVRALQAGTQASSEKKAA